VVLNEDPTCVGPEHTLRLHSDFTCTYPILRGRFTTSIGKWWGNIYSEI